MQKHDIARTVLNYINGNSERYAGMLHEDRHYLVQKPSDLDGYGGSKEVVYGNIMDVVADTIERNRFFGDWVGSSPSQATNCNNGKIRPIEAGERLEGIDLIVSGLDAGNMSIDVRVVAPKPYLEGLKTIDGYKSALGVLVYNEELDNLADRLWRR